MALSAVLVFPVWVESALVRSASPRCCFFLFFECVFAGGEDFFSVRGACFGEPSFNPVASRAVGSCEGGALVATGELVARVELAADEAPAVVGVINDGVCVGAGEVRVGFEMPVVVDGIGAGVCCLATGADVPNVGLGVTVGGAMEGEADFDGALKGTVLVDTDSQSRLTACIN